MRQLLQMMNGAAVEAAGPATIEGGGGLMGAHAGGVRPSPSHPSQMGLFWSAEGIGDPTAPFQLSGRHVAPAAWMTAVAQHTRADAIDIFTPFGAIDACRQQFGSLIASAPPGSRRVVRILPETGVPACFHTDRYDVLHHTGDFIRLSYIRSRFSRRVIPVTCSQHAVSYSSDLHPYYLPLLSAQVYPCDAVVCLTEASRQALQRRLTALADSYARLCECTVRPLPRLEVVPWGVDTQRFAPRDRTTARRDFHLPPDRPIVLCVSRMRIQDKMDWTPLLLAFQRVRGTAKEPPLFILAGPDSEYSGQIISRAAQLGLHNDLSTFFSVPPVSLPSLYAACDIFIAPTESPSESFGLTIVEAMACGRPVIASDWNGYKELIVHGDTGFKVRTDWADCLGEANEVAPFLPADHEHLHVGQSVSVDVPQMARYMTQLLENPDRGEEMGRRARARVEALYGWPGIIRRWEELWSELGAIARTLERKEPHGLDYLQPNYFQHFAHYASRVIDDGLPVEITERGESVLGGKAPLFLHPAAQAFLRADYLLLCLSALRPARWLRVSLRVGDLITTVHRIGNLTRDQALMHLMWLAKYDLVSIGEERAPRRQVPGR